MLVAHPKMHTNVIKCGRIKLLIPTANGQVSPWYFSIQLLKAAFSPARHLAARNLGNKSAEQVHSAPREPFANKTVPTQCQEYPKMKENDDFPQICGFQAPKTYKNDNPCPPASAAILVFIASITGIAAEHCSGASPPQTTWPAIRLTRSMVWCRGKMPCRPGTKVLSLKDSAITNSASKEDLIMVHGGRNANHLHC